MLNSRSPACLEGAWIMPNGLCTPNCQVGYEPNHPSFSCFLEAYGMSYAYMYVYIYIYGIMV